MAGAALLEMQHIVVPVGGNNGGGNAQDRKPRIRAILAKLGG